MEKLNNSKIRDVISKLKGDILKNYDLVWLLEQALNPGPWEIFQVTCGQNNGFLIKRQNLYWVSPKTGEELNIFYAFVKRELPGYIHCYEKWIGNYIESKEYQIIKNENIYYVCNRENFNAKKKSNAVLLEYDEINQCKDKWFSPELLDFLRQNQRVYGILEEDNTLVGWCYIDTLTKGVAEVYRLEIHPMRRRRGFAGEILSKSLEKAFEKEEQIVFNLKITNEAAMGLIKKIGFKEIQREYRYLIK
ncbi:GNAT family N-acetyltransferase [Alkalicella caledoniensis]|uniref:GNAT family N-acetyltransferase n=1 Tax=Alkalicella caledoniensis TaxID=2731377 RepID=A0A7G9W4U4_ALKCA|nr:GNAT family N-acetyltransferase [Alkalicella caledoniensis]QNO13706.1 GNAT family N-acetyltransferase [Alkalicella caledoniensis]